MCDLNELKLEKVKGLGTVFVEKCNSLGIISVNDLLHHYPRKYLDRTNQLSIATAVIGEEATVYGTIEKISSRYMKNRKMMVEGIIFDGDARMKITFFNQPWRVKQLSEGTQGAFFAKVDDFRGQLQMVNPVVDVIREGSSTEGDKTSGIIPIYPASGKAELSTWMVRRAMKKILKYSDELDDVLSQETLDKLKLVSRAEAFRLIHDPESGDDARKGTRRLRFDEFFMLQMVLVGKYRHVETKIAGYSLDEDNLEKEFISNLPFQLTGDQQKAIEEIDVDMKKSHPMHRLLQGDVGSGKTAVAFAAAARAISNNAQVIIMAPTEVLAKQHFESAKKMFSKISIVDESNLFSARTPNIEMLSTNVGSKDRDRIQKLIDEDNLDIIIGTHALLYQEYKYKKLGLVVVDEQHRFGVDQRSKLIAGNEVAPHLLVMSATPIPRTAAMLFFGDLKNTVIKELPKGRKAIKTTWSNTQAKVDKAYKKVREEIAKGAQAYVVCPLVEASAKVEAASAVEKFEELSNGELKGLKLGLIHGQMKGADKERVMKSFVENEIDVLVSTTVIEVGVDVPNASVMVIEDADRFGLSQLHQLRGRVGRGSRASFCFLCTSKSTDKGALRLDAMETISDGFELAEIDLEMRGAGHLLGGVQSGIGDLKLGVLPRDAKYVDFAREVAEKMYDEDDQLTKDENKVLKAELIAFLEQNEIEFLFKS